ncbi:hypothetical protein Cflav_PD1544 [Pedosphaera parvula Ellin514]|uniref:Uncharacterized protein n=1 Tax=Pedosphaera parvula (strain Ellin514) TaxID=320771 RepID=B9XNI4_PEDPL|nr:hypothetical protein Cflav_PD1544 [Pedosphaera parvula Ellin514]
MRKEEPIPTKRRLHPDENGVTEIIITNALNKKI